MHKLIGAVNKMGLHRNGKPINYGTKKIECVDRHHQRKVDEKQEQLQKAERKASRKEEKIKEQEKKVEESKEKDHGTRLDQRNNRLAVLKAEHAKIETQKEAIKEGIEKLGPPGTRYDRDFRKQSIRLRARGYPSP